MEGIWYDGLGFDAEDQHHKKSAENLGHISSESGMCILPSLCHSLNVLWVHNKWVFFFGQ